jgi:predicted SprT family Zn-dependent metalloprotease
MTATTTAKVANATKTPKQIEDMLRDIAMVLHLTKKVKAEIVRDRVTPTGGRFAKQEPLQLDPAILEEEFAFA